MGRRHDWTLRPELMRRKAVPVGNWPTVADIPPGALVMDSDGVVKQKVGDYLVPVPVTIIGSGPLASAPVASADNLGLCYLETGDPLWPNGALWSCVKAKWMPISPVEYTAASKGSLNYWATQFRIPNTASTSKIRLRFSNMTANEINFSFLVANTNAQNGARSSVGDTITENLLTGWKTVVVTIPANSYAYSNWIENTFLPAVDGGNSLFLVRQPNMDGIGYKLSAPNNSNPVDGWRSYTTLTTNLSTSGVESTSILTCMGFEIDNAQLVKRSVAIGDSITYGAPSNVSWYGFANYQMTTEYNLGIPGYKTDQFLTILENELATENPAFVIYSPFSPNDGVSESSTAAMKERFLQACSMCYRKGAVIIPTDLTPNNTYTVGQYALRDPVIEYAKSLAFSNINLRPAVSQGVSPDRFITGYNADNLHPSSTGYDAMRALYNSLIQSIYASDYHWIRVLP